MPLVAPFSNRRKSFIFIERNYLYW